MINHFAIYGLHGRVGSCWLAELLAPAVLPDPHEIWQPVQRKRARRLGVKADPCEQPAKYVKQFCDVASKEYGQGEIRGVRAFPHYLPEPADELLVQGLDLVIFLYRRNITEQMVSLRVAKRCGWRGVTQRRPPRPLVLDVDGMIATFEEASVRWKRVVRLVPEDRRKIVAYEDISDRASELRHFVGLDTVVPEPKEARKQRSPERYRRLISNYDEINERMGERYGVLFGEHGTFGWGDYLRQ